MRTLVLVAVTTATFAFGLASCRVDSTNVVPLEHPNYHAPALVVPHQPGKTMRGFQSEQELAKYLHELVEKQKRNRDGKFGYELSGGAVLEKSESLSVPADKQSSANEDSVTNVQEAGVDEGGIVKVHGNHLIVLRRGRLFTVAIGDGALNPISSIDAFAPDIDPRSTWYDEMLVSDDTIAVIGYSYERGGTEIGLFDINPAGKLTYRSTYHLRSNDYYSSRNYASRLIGTKLIFYSPLYLYPGQDPAQSLPAIRKWHKGATRGEFRRIVTATNVYHPEHEFKSAYTSALHTVTVCDLARGDFDCRATAVVGPAGRVFYVSSESVYVWVSDWVPNGTQIRTESMVFRLPLDGSSPTALGVSGSPVDQFSFLESDHDHLNVLLRSETAGGGMWGPEVTAGEVALLRIPLASFSDGSETVSSSAYRALPKPRGYTFQNRFVGGYLLYGTGSGWGNPQNAGHVNLYAVPWAGGRIHHLSLAHGVDRIEEIGSDAVVVGTDGTNLHFSSIRLGEAPEVAHEYMRKGASQGELRSQGFFYKADTQDSGVLGLPISTPARAGYHHLFENSAAILFLRNNALHFQEVGELAARPERATEDGCRASCVDWYGNTRPLFVHGRVIALLGYELVEGTLDAGHMQESRRVSYAPASLTASRVEDSE